MKSLFVLAAILVCLVVVMIAAKKWLNDPRFLKGW